MMKVKVVWSLSPQQTEDKANACLEDLAQRGCQVVSVQTATAVTQNDVLATEPRPLVVLTIWYEEAAGEGSKPPARSSVSPLRI